MSRFRVGLLAGVSATMLAAAAPAPAVTRSVEYGTPGAAEMPAVRGWWNPNGGTLRIPSRHVARAPGASQPQSICAEFTLYRFTSEYYVAPWAFDATRHWCRRADPRQRALFPAWRFSALAYSSYTLSVAITWRVSGGDRLSSAVYDYDEVADYRCQTGNCVSALRFGGVGSIRFDS